MVVDEADELLRGGYERDVKTILTAFQAADRETVARSACRVLGISYDTFLQLPRHIRKAGLEGAAPSATRIFMEEARCTSFERSC